LRSTASLKHQRRRDGMRAALIAAAMLGACATASAERAHTDSIEPLMLEAGHGAPAGCNPDDIPVDATEASAASESPCPPHASDSDQTARARAYLIATATPGYTMTRQGPALAIGRLHPGFVKQLAAAISEARAAGLPFAGIFSAYRPPAFGVGGFADKFLSLHTYGLAVDITGIGAPAPRPRCSGTRSRHGTAWSAPTGRTIWRNGITASRRR
jgi:hypothetical protein